MRAESENSVSSFLSIDGVLRDNVSLWTANVAFTKSVTKFRGLLGTIQDLVAQMSIGSKGATEIKQAHRDVMTAETLKMAGLLHAFASESGDADLEAKTDLVESDLTRLRDGEVGSACQAIHDLAETHVADLADDGTTAADVTAFQTVIDNYGGVAGKPRQKRTENSAAITQLEDAVRSTRGVLDGQLDKRMLKFKVSQPAFYESYVNSRRIVDNRGGLGKNGNGNGNGQPPVPPT